MAEETLHFQDIYTAFQPKIHRYLRGMVGDHEAEDLAQEVFVKVSRGLKDFRGESQLSTWIYRIATNVALDRLRSPSFHRTDNNVLNDGPTAEGETEMSDKDVWTGEKAPSIDRQFVRKEMNACIRGFVEGLTANYRTVIVLSELEGMKNREIAEILGVTLDAVKIRLHRARRKLKKELEASCSFYRDEQNELACDLKSAFRAAGGIG